jgi:hypothetical protein
VEVEESTVVLRKLNSCKKAFFSDFSNNVLVRQKETAVTGSSSKFFFLSTLFLSFFERQRSKEGVVKLW